MSPSEQFFHAGQQKKAHHLHTGNTAWQQSQRSHHWWQLALCRVMPCTKLGTKKAWKPERILLGKGVSKQATSLHKKNYRGAEVMSTAKEGI